MKKIIYVRLILMSTSFFFTTVATSQSSSGDIAGVKHSASTARTTDAAADKMVLAGLKEVNVKMYNHFTKHFKNAVNLKSRAVDNDGTRIDFKQNGVSTGVRYNAKGRWMFTISNYEAFKLDDDTRDMVESAYPGFLVGGFVIEISVLDKTSKLIMIENSREWKRIRLLDGELSIYEEYTKQ